ncbi:shikimate dehydrogenase [Solirubrobacter sp. CPCC 204708]|uniref:Shikimate dehydrogenase (NADP(+)) n=1 Tax=Solirubrobacter deserti TaxID=2282478 RepID=A0ABT4RHV7_9ACTN|nr:shikimate dehydrogenase [Solirubrobacter deserti]MBE2316584.1 shikimate dehydrogenase [Solirubrobacter deserti]MDA0138116.1 shikimate dehydrogenase [Solirubrobacter deserti]
MRLGVCGWPVAHSRSPQMHNAALQHLGLSTWRYQKLPLPPELFAEVIPNLPRLGFRGVNVTIPHKEAALLLADNATETAKQIGAANTLTFEPDGTIHADNTDATGFLTSLRTSAYGKTALVLGAGGSARAILYALQQAGVSELRVWNRTEAKAHALAQEFTATVSAEPAEIIVNCTSVGLHDPSATFKELPLSADDLYAGCTVVDMVYRNGGTLLLNAAKANGAEVVDGLEILVAQGAASLERWTGRTAPDQAMREAVADIAT